MKKIQKEYFAHKGMKALEFKKKSFYVDSTTTKQIRKKSFLTQTFLFQRSPFSCTSLLSAEK